MVYVKVHWTAIRYRSQRRGDDVIDEDLAGISARSPKSANEAIKHEVFERKS